MKQSFSPTDSNKSNIGHNLTYENTDKNFDEVVQLWLGGADKDCLIIEVRVVKQRVLRYCIPNEEAHRNCSTFALRVQKQKDLVVLLHSARGGRQGFLKFHMNFLWES